MADDTQQLEMQDDGAPEYTLEEIQSGLPQHDSILERAKTLAEGAAQGIAGPVGTATAIGLGSDPEMMRERAAAHPIAHKAAELGGFLATIGAGSGLAPVVGRIGQGVEALTGLSGVAGSSVKLATEMALLSAGDETSKLIMNDPEQSMGSALTNVGTSALLGMGGGAALGGLGKLWDVTAGSKAKQFLEDFKGRINYHMENPNPVEGLTRELEDHYHNVTSMADEVYGPQGLKAQDISKAVPEANEKIISQVGDVGSKLSDALETMRAKPELYPPNLTAKLEQWGKIFNEGVEGQFKDSKDYFNSIQELKQRLQSVAKYGERVPQIAPEYDFISKSRELADHLKTSLEDSGVWGKAAKRQQDINKAFTDFLPSLKDFESRFTTKLGDGSRAIDPGKVNTYLNQLGKPNAELKQEMLNNFLNASEKYKNVVDKTHLNLGLDAPEWHNPLNMSKSTLSKLPNGAKMADVLVKRGLAKFGGSALGGTIGALGGKMVGMPGIGAIIGEHTLGPMLETILPALTKPILGNMTSVEGLKGAVDYGMAVVKGERVLSSAARNIFKAGHDVLPEKLIPTPQVIEKFDKQLKAASNDKQRLMNTGSAVAHYLPQHTVAMTSAALNIIKTMDAVRPNTSPDSPLSEDREPNRIELAKYNSALMIAQQPAILLPKIKDGNITPGEVAMLQQLHPGAYANMKNKIVAALADHTSKGGLVPYKTQLGLSTFLGQPLSSSLQPVNIAMNQMLPPPGGQPQEGAASGTEATGQQKAALQKLSGMYNTPIQARERDKSNA